ncbi:CID domain and RNA polymerase II-binding domain-containing protein [Strongyloides ratti]|uniref:CID domain and RNA polymerase II-binding domain-containing protein n=1 Tax=Strongyloides ratti TaxID=34506 RepID=A0A090LAJ7_STRRB|nr:CID domain and RNA polymerase II-binding domain-containing protein [Strongyloides ratti]CEF66806.1 CID domain and RNA polymerase II-binding domain-containing protein [Strongyloides ratti]
MASDNKSQDAFEAELRMALRLVHDDDTQVRNCSTLFRKKPSRIEDCCKLWLNFFQNSPKVKGIKSDDGEKAMDKVRKHRLGLLYVFNDTVQRIRSELPSCLESYKQAFYNKVVEACEIQSKDKDDSIIRRWERTFKILGERKCFSPQEIENFIGALHGKNVNNILENDKEEEITYLNFDDEVRVISDIIHLAGDYNNVGMDEIYDEEDKTRRLRECKIRKQCLTRCLELFNYFNKFSTKQDKQRNNLMREKVVELLAKYNEFQEKLFLFGTPVPLISTQCSDTSSNFDSGQQNVQLFNDKDEVQNIINDTIKYNDNDKFSYKDNKEFRRSSSKDKVHKDNSRNGRGDYRDRRKDYDNGHRYYHDSKPKSYNTGPPYNNYHRRSNDKYSFGRRRDDHYSRPGGHKDRGSCRERSPRRHNNWRSQERRRSLSRSPTRRSNFYNSNKQRYD